MMLASVTSCLLAHVFMSCLLVMPALAFLAQGCGGALLLRAWTRQVCWRLELPPPMPSRSPGPEDTAPDLALLLRPLHPCHLGVLARCYACSPPAAQASDARALLLTNFGVDVHVDEVAAALARLLQRCPALLGGPPVELQWALPTSTVLLPSVESCVDCAELLSLSPLREAQAYFLNYGWVSVRYRTGTCTCCRAQYSTCWRMRPRSGARCAATVSPEDCQFFQIVANPRRNSKAFIEMRVLWLLRASLLRNKGTFSGFVTMLADMHAAAADRSHDCLRFEHHWLLWEVLCLLWENSADFVQSVFWPLDSTHDASDFRSCLTEVFPVLQQYFQETHFLQHSCRLCEARVVTFDAKYGLACHLCNHRDGGGIHFPNIEATVLFGCQEPPQQGCLYCRTHNAAPPSPVGPAPRVLRHRDVGGVRTYKIEGASSWRAAADVPAASVREYEIHLAAAAERRKRRRGQVPPPPPPVIAEGADADDAEAHFYDTMEAALQQQPDEANPCGIDKCTSVPQRRYGGLLVATLPCGRVCAQMPLANAESLTQVYALLSMLSCHDQHPLRYVMYDNACALARYARHPCRAGRTLTSQAMAAFTYVLDGFHRHNHTACLDPGHAMFLPEVRRESHPELQGVNSQTAEQFFAWADAFVPGCSAMAPAVFRTFMLILAHWYNLRVCDAVPSRSRKTRTQSPGPRAAASTSPRVPVGEAPRLRLRRNPYGVGYWGAGKFHWLRDSDAPRPPCAVVCFATLPQEVTVAATDVVWEPQINGFVFEHAGGKSEICRRCASAMRAQRLLG